MANVNALTTFLLSLPKMTHEGVLALAKLTAGLKNAPPEYAAAVAAELARRRAALN